MSEKGLLVIFSAPSGCGKDSILSELRSREECKDYVLSISMTTRPPRADEKDGIDYFFVSKEIFKEHILSGDLIEYAEYNGNYYGTPYAPVKKWLVEGKTVFLEIEVQGAEKIMKICPDALSVFIMPPSIEELERRLRSRHTDSDETIRRRIAIAPEEIKRSVNFDHCVVNDDIVRAADEVYKIIEDYKEKIRND